VKEAKKPRPLGIKIIAGIFFLESAILLSSALASYLLSPSQVAYVGQFFGSIPYFNRLPIATDMPSMIFAALLGIWAGTKGLGIWFMWGWVRMLILLDLAGRFGDFMLAASMMDHKQLNALTHNPDFVGSLLLNLAVLLYLADSGVEEEFES
jgi:hypothetical protein